MEDDSVHDENRPDSPTSTLHPLTEEELVSHSLLLSSSHGGHEEEEAGPSSPSHSTYTLPSVLSVPSNRIPVPCGKALHIVGGEEWMRVPLSEMLPSRFERKRVTLDCPVGVVPSLSPSEVHTLPLPITDASVHRIAVQRELQALIPVVEELDPWLITLLPGRDAASLPYQKVHVWFQGKAPPLTRVLRRVGDILRMAAHHSDVEFGEMETFLNSSERMLEVREEEEPHTNPDPAQEDAEGVSGVVEEEKEEEKEGEESHHSSSGTSGTPPVPRPPPSVIQPLTQLKDSTTKEVVLTLEGCITLPLLSSLCKVKSPLLLSNGRQCHTWMQGADLMIEEWKVSTYSPPSFQNGWECVLLVQKGVHTPPPSVSSFPSTQRRRTGSSYLEAAFRRQDLRERKR